VGENLMIHSYLKNKFFNGIDSGIMVEVGSAGPEFLSQSKPFRDIGWRCICIDPNPEFVKMHRDVGNEIYEYACSYEDRDSVNFEMVTQPINGITYESFSSIEVSERLALTGYSNGKKDLSINTIKVNVRKLDTILKEAKVSKVDYVIVDVEGWELNVMEGFTSSKYQPKVIVLENAFADTYQEFNTYMTNLGYEFDSFDDTTGPNLVYFNKNY
jgi:FkbM family methyltransferase